MQIEMLKIYCDVIDLGSFSKAAEANDVTQSMASQAVRKLEEYFNSRLIDRSHRPWRVSGQGRLCYDRCKTLVDNFYKLESEMRAACESAGSELRVASIYSAGFVYMSRLEATFKEQFPGEKLFVSYDHPNRIIERILGNEIDIGIVAFPAKHRDLLTSPWKKEEMVAVAAPNHLLSALDEVKVGDLHGYTFIGFDPNLEVGRRIRKFLKQRDVNYRVELCFDNIEAIKRAVEAGNHIAILPRVTLEREVAGGSLKAVRFSDTEFYRELAVVTRKGHEPSAAFNHFMTMLSNKDF